MNKIMFTLLDHKSLSCTLNTETRGLAESSLGIPRPWDLGTKQQTLSKDAAQAGPHMHTVNVSLATM